MPDNLKRFLIMLFGAVLLSSILGICLDLVTANVAVEYFTVHHPKIVESENPFLLAILWGVGASWWFGAIVGFVLGLINHYRRRPLNPTRILKWGAVGCVLLWLVMILVLIGVYSFAGTIPIEKRSETFESDRRLMSVAMAHQFEYLLGGIALLVLAAMTWRATAHTE